MYAKYTKCGAITLLKSPFVFDLYRVNNNTKDYIVFLQIISYNNNKNNNNNSNGDATIRGDYWPHDKQPESGDI